jgi:transcriptional regulator with XRE-family HTH domain
MADAPELPPLAAFLRSRRERVRPEDVGLPAGTRRRTPGLRREEVAQLAGISVDYLVRLEQGREHGPSAPVLASLSRALLLDHDERVHLNDLVSGETRRDMCTTPPGSPKPVNATTLALLDRLHPAPAFLLERTTEVVAWNPAYERLARPTGLFDLDPPNLIRYTFLHPAARTLYRDWDAIADEQVSNLRAAWAHFGDDGPVESLVAELSAESEPFVARWRDHDVAEKRRGTKRLDHPVVGHLDLEFEALLVPDPGERRLVTYLPIGQVSSERLDRLVGEEPASAARTVRHLRVVGGDVG